MKKIRQVKSIALISLSMLLPFLLHAQGLRINRGANVVVSGDAKIVLNDAGIVNQGAFSAGNSTVVFTGNASQAVAGNISLSFYNVIIDLPSAKLQLENDIAVSGMLAFKNGNLELNRHNIDLGKTGIIDGENAVARITGENGGTVTTTASLNAPRNVNPGNIGISLSSAASFGPTIITRGHLAQTNAAGQSGIQRYYQVVPAYNSTANIDVRFIYLEPELGNNKESELMLWSNTDNGQGWIANNAERNDAAGNIVLTNSLKASNRFTLGPGSNDMMKAKANAGLKMPGIQSVNTYPNPAQEKFTLAVTSLKNMEGNVLLQDDHGRTLEKRPVTYRSGLNTIEWNMGKYASGTYYLVFENILMTSVKIIKQ